MYFAFNNTRNNPKAPHQEFYPKLFDEIDKQTIDKFVIDLRWNGGGNTANGIPLIYEIIKRDKINQHGKLFVIVGRQTLSAAINIADLLERHTNAIFDRRTDRRLA